MLSQTRLKVRLKRKTNPSLVETIQAARKHEAWMNIAKIVSSSSSRYSSLNLFQIDSKVSAGDTIVVPGKILSKGELTKKIVIAALSISESAKEKLKHSKSEFIHLSEEIKKNPKAEGIKLLR